MENSNPTTTLPNAHLFGIMPEELNEIFWCELGFIRTLRLIPKALMMKA